VLELIWRLRCPRSPEECARDFIEKRLPSQGVERLVALDADQLRSRDAFVVDQLRRIAYIYGLARDGSFAPAWNRRLIAKLGGGDIEEAARRLLGLARDLAREGAGNRP
jgi:hypothetical protein